MSEMRSIKVLDFKQDLFGVRRTSRGRRGEPL